MHILQNLGQKTGSLVSEEIVDLPDAGRRTMAFCILMQDDRTMETLGHLVSVTDGRDVVDGVSDKQNRVVGCSVEVAGVWPFGSSVPLCSQYIDSLLCVEHSELT